MKEYRPLLIALAVMALLTPVGLYFPEIMKAGGAWGEWGVDEVRKMVGYAPPEMGKSAKPWKAPLPDYALPGQATAPLGRRSLGYVVSALAGAAACGGGAYLAARHLSARKRKGGGR